MTFSTVVLRKYGSNLAFTLAVSVATLNPSAVCAVPMSAAEHPPEAAQPENIVETVEVAAFIAVTVAMPTSLPTKDAALSSASNQSTSKDEVPQKTKSNLVAVLRGWMAERNPATFSQSSNQLSAFAVPRVVALRLAPTCRSYRAPPKDYIEKQATCKVASLY
jgi:hypothetical protein